METFYEGLNMALNSHTLLAILGGVLLGIIFGATPGFTDLIGMTVAIPLTYAMSPVVALGFMIGIYVAGDFAGSIPAILVAIPGTSQSMVTMIDGHKLARKGKSNEAMGVALTSSCIGGLIGVIVLFLIIQIIVRVALRFGPPEIFLVAVLGLTVIAFMHESNTLKAIIAGFFGILLGTIGMTIGGSLRGTFGLLELYDGIPIIPALMGFVGMAELFHLIQAQKKYILDDHKDVIFSKTGYLYNISKVLNGAKEVFKYKLQVLRSALIGVWIGILPAAGAVIASIISYNEGRRTTKNPNYGNGEYEGVVCAEAANNSCMGGSAAIMLALGVPGSTGTVVLMGVLILHGIVPGPRLYLENMPLINGIILSMALALFLLFIFGGLFCGFASRVLNIPTKLLIPVVTVLIIAGSFTIRRSLLDLILVLIFGLIGYLMKQYDYPPMATVLGIILGPIADKELIRTYEMFAGNLWLIFTRPICLMLIALALFAVIYPMLKRKKQKETASNESNSANY